MEIEIQIQKPDNFNLLVANDNTNEVIRLINNAFDFTFHDARDSTSSGTETEQKEKDFFGPVSNTMRLITQRDGHLSTYFDIIYGSEAAFDKSLRKKTS